MLCGICGKNVDSNAILKIRTITELVIIPSGGQCITLETESVECDHEIPLELE